MSVRADLDSLRSMLGKKSTEDDKTLSTCLEAAGAWVYDRVCASDVRDPEVVQAVLLLASRLYKRRLSPEGVAGWDDAAAVRVISRDPDVDRLIEQHVDAYQVWGIACSATCAHRSPPSCTTCRGPSTITSLTTSARCRALSWTGRPSPSMCSTTCSRCRSS